MNERIEELAKQAGYQDLPTVRLAFSGFNKEKFAELIIEECVEICLIHRVRNNDYNEGRTQCASDIKEHFGVE